MQKSQNPEYKIEIPDIWSRCILENCEHTLGNMIFFGAGVETEKFDPKEIILKKSTRLNYEKGKLERVLKGLLMMNPNMNIKWE